MATNNDLEDFGTDIPEDDGDHGVNAEVAEAPSSPKEADGASIIKPNQWVYRSHNSFGICSKTVGKLSSGYYGVSSDRNDNLIYTKKQLEIDNLFNFHGSFLESVVLDIENFWNKRDLFKQYGFLHRRGYLFYGIQGGGKTSLVHQILANIVKRDGIVFEGSGKSPDLISSSLKQFREIEPQRNIVCLFEDIDAIIRECGESKFLSMVDGEDSINHVLYIATTNYPERLDKRIIARPRRFDRVIKIDPPDATIRKEYFTKKLQIEGNELDKYVQASEDFTFAAMTELVISTKCLEVDFDEAVKVIKNLMLKKVSSEDYNTSGGKLGFGSKG
jgi:hypothetical protein